jgi:hypothetical protein
MDIFQIDDLEEFEEAMLDFASLKVHAWFRLVFSSM